MSSNTFGMTWKLVIETHQDTHKRTSIKQVCQDSAKLLEKSLKGHKRPEMSPKVLRIGKTRTFFLSTFSPPLHGRHGHYSTQTL